MENDANKSETPLNGLGFLLYKNHVFTKRCLWSLIYFFLYK